jgi:4'-phosphopantetheinyl transferase
VTELADLEYSAFSRLDAGGELVHVWVVDLDDPSFPAAALAGLLSPDELARAARFRFDRDRHRFTVGRGLLRVLLGAYLNEEPAAIEFEYGASGKPRLRPSARAPELSDLEFNLAHSDACAVFAFTHATELGVDVEQLRPVREFGEIADRFFSPAEAERVRHTDPAARVDAFYRCWTRKEAFIKALGDGLSRPLDSFCVTINSDESPCVEWASGEPDAAGSWSLHHVEPRPGFVAALALRRPSVRLLQLQVRPQLKWVRALSERAGDA